MSEDEVTAYLAEVRIRAGFAAPGMFKSSAMESAADVPRLLAAVEAVLDLTGKAVRAEHPTLGGMVLAAFGLELQEAISAALLGEVASHD